MSDLVQKPIIPVYPYQASVLDDSSRLVGWLKSRQIGGSFICTLKMVLQAVETGEDWNTMSRSQRQAEKLLKKAATHVRAINDYSRKFLGLAPVAKESDIGSQRIRLCNGATLEALPCDPDTTTGDTCNWLIDEFALFPNSERVFGVIKPSIMHGKRMIIVSSPRGRQNKFYDLYEKWTRDPTTSGWSFHKTTIRDAISDGFCPSNETGDPMTLAQFRDQEIRDIGSELWAQEFMCSFSDRLISFLSFELISRCAVNNLKPAMTPGALVALKKDLFVGIDIGRKRDLTVIWIVSRSGDTYTTEAVHVLERQPFREQERVIRQVMECGRILGCIVDETGIGLQLAENLSIDFPGIVRGLAFTNSNKAEMAGRLKSSMESEAFWFPHDDDIIQDFSSVERTITDGGNVRLAAPRGSGGHGDRFWAAAMAIQAGMTCKPFKLVMAA